MKTVLISIPWFHPAFRAGGPIQSIANMVEAIKDVQFRIFCGDTDLNAEPLNVSKGSWTVYNDNTHVWYTEKGKAREQFREIIDHVKPDLVLAIGIFSSSFTLVPILFSKTIPVILSVRGMMHPGALSQKSVKKKIYLHFLKQLSKLRRVSFHATDNNEASFVKAVMGSRARVFVAGNFSRHFAFQSPNKEPGLLRLISIGLISPMKNHLLTLEALTQITSEIEYRIYGPVKDEKYWEACKKFIGSCPPNIKVLYGGELNPWNIESALLDSDVFILPSKSENFGHAILEALSAGKPVITSRNTPWNLLEEQHAGMNVDLAAAALAEAISFFAKMKTTDFAGWALHARSYAEQSSRHTEVSREYHALFNAVIYGRNSPLHLNNKLL